MIKQLFNIKKKLVIALCLSLAGFILLIYNLDTNKKITIIQTSDIHANIAYKDKGFLKQAYLIQKIVKQNGGRKNCLLIDCGDLFQGTFESAETKGEIIPKLFNKLKYDVFVPGNHDFDYGLKQFKKLVSVLNCNIIAANLKFNDSTQTVLPWKIFELNNKKVAVIGMTNPNLKYWLYGKKFNGIDTISIEKSLKSLLPKVLKNKPDLIILAVHQGLYQNKRYPNGSNLIDIAYKFPQIDLILGGHSHKTYHGKIIGRKVFYVQAGSHGEQIAVIDVDFNKNKQITSKILSVSSSPQIKITKKQNQILTKLNKIKNKLLLYNKTLSNSAEFIAKAMCKISKSDLAFYCSPKNKMKFNLKTQGDVFKLIPYDDNIIKLFLTGSEIKQIYEQFNKYFSSKNKYQYFAYYSDKEISSIYNLHNKIIYPVAFSSYDAAGGGNRFPLLRKLGLNPKIKKLNTNLLIRKAVLKYIINKNQEQ